MIDFVHLHLHTGFSLADASLKPKQLAKKVKELGMKAVAITDHGNLFGVIEFYKACKNEGIKPILGIEAYVAPRTNRQKEGHSDDANYHLVLLAENEEGYHNLIQIASDASLEGMYYKPRTDKLRLRRFCKGIIALSACLGGEVQELLLNGRYREARDAALFYEEIFGKGNFYLELQNHGLSDQTVVNNELLRLHRETGIPLVCTNDCHYLEQKDYAAHDVLMAIQAKTTIDDTKRKKYNSDQFYLKSPQEMYKLFGHIPDAIENTAKIADRCNVNIEFGKNKLPKFYAPVGFTNYEFLKKLVYDGAAQLYPQITQEIVDRIEYELSTVERMGYIDYFLITWDFIRYARENGILVGPGRGSGAGSIMLYCLWITRIDPLKYDLLFERFLDPSRISMPDVDLDYQDDRRNEVIEYVVSKYGRGSVCQIITFGTMAARAAIRAVGRALDYTYSTCDTMAKLVPFEPGITLNDALKVSIDFRTRYEADPKIRYLIDTAIALEGLPLYTGTHAAGVLITDELGVTAHVPVWKTDKGVVSQFHMGNLEDLGLLKMDFLGLSTLTVISKAKKWIKQNYGVDVNLDELYKCEDLAPLQLIKDGHTDGLFQLESSGMTHFMTELRPRDLEEIIAGISLYRPGPMDSIPKFLSNRRNESKIEYQFKELQPVLSTTYGVTVYQEQCMQAVIVIAGYQKHHSDSFRKAIGKKKKDLIAEHRNYFIYGREEKIVDGIVVKDSIPGGLMMGHDLKALEKFYDEMEDFGKYAFNKSHGAAYAVIAYLTAWFKFYYPTEFMAALMDSVIKNKPRVARYIDHCQRDLGITISPPSINVSQEEFVPLLDKKIVFSLTAKNVSMEAVRKICEIRGEAQLANIYEFFERCYEVIDKQTLEALIAIGALNELGVLKSRYMAGLDDIVDSLRKVRDAKKRFETPSKSKRPMKKKPFVFEDRFALDNFIPEIKEYTEVMNLKLEKNFLGLYLSGHPLDRYRYAIENLSNFKTSDIDYEIDEETGDIILLSDAFSDPKDVRDVRFIAVLNAKKEVVTKKKDLMAMLEVEDLYGTCKVTVFPVPYEEIKPVLKVDEIYEIRGKVSCKQGDVPSVIAASMIPISQIILKRVIINATDAYQCKAIAKYIPGISVSGNSPVYLQCGKVRVLLPKECWVDADLFFRYLDREVIAQEQITIREW